MKSRSLVNATRTRCSFITTRLVHSRRIDESERYAALLSMIGRNNPQRRSISIQHRESFAATHALHDPRQRSAELLGVDDLVHDQLEFISSPNRCKPEVDTHTRSFSNPFQSSSTPCPGVAGAMALPSTIGSARAR